MALTGAGISAESGIFIKIINILNLGNLGIFPRVSRDSAFNGGNNPTLLVLAHELLPQCFFDP